MTSQIMAPRRGGDRVLPGSLFGRSSSRDGFRPTPARLAQRFLWSLERRLRRGCPTRTGTTL
jgi:hypothetical protein